MAELGVKTRTDSLVSTEKYSASDYSEDGSLLSGSHSELNSDENDSIYGSAEALQKAAGTTNAEDKAVIDDDEDRKNPQYIPKKGNFYEHDNRAGEEDAKKAAVRQPARRVWKDGDRWQHDRFDPNQQAPKSQEELVDSYGYDIRGEDLAPRARRRRRYGNGPSKYTRSWDDESAYGRPRGGPRGGGRGYRGGGGGRSRGGGREIHQGQQQETRRPMELSDRDRDFPSLDGAERKPNGRIDGQGRRSDGSDRQPSNKHTAAPARVFHRQQSAPDRHTNSSQQPPQRITQSETGAGRDRSSSDAPRRQPSHRGGGVAVTGRRDDVRLDDDVRDTSHQQPGSQLASQPPPATSNHDGQETRRGRGGNRSVQVPPRLQEQMNRPKRYSSQRQRPPLPAPHQLPPPQQPPAVYYETAEGAGYASGAPLFAAGDHSTPPPPLPPAPFMAPPAAALYAPPTAAPPPAPPFAPLPFPGPPPPAPPPQSAPAFAPVGGFPPTAQPPPPTDPLLPVVESGGVTYYNMHAQAPPGMSTQTYLHKRPKAAIPILAPPVISDTDDGSSGVGVERMSTSSVSEEPQDSSPDEVMHDTRDAGVGERVSSESFLDGQRDVAEDVATLSLQENADAEGDATADAVVAVQRAESAEDLSDFNTPPSGASPSYHGNASSQKQPLNELNALTSSSESSPSHLASTSSSSSAVPSTSTAASSSDPVGSSSDSYVLDKKPEPVEELWVDGSNQVAAAGYAGDIVGDESLDDEQLDVVVEEAVATVACPDEQPGHVDPSLGAMLGGEVKPAEIAKDSCSDQEQCRQDGVLVSTEPVTPRPDITNVDTTVPIAISTNITNVNATAPVAASTNSTNVGTTTPVASSTNSSISENTT